MTTRKAAWQALADLLESTAGVVTVSRRFIYWDQLTPSQKPACIIIQDGETHERLKAIPDKRTLYGRILVYTAPETSPDSTVNPADELNDLLDAIQVSLTPEPFTGVQTLGGLVSNCWIDGEIQLEAGDADGFGLAAIPIKILVP